MLIWVILIFSAVLIGVGFLADWWYKKNGINVTDPRENEAHVSGMERTYVESHMNQMRDDLNNHGM
ncbi:hypothetical protein [Bacillus sp. B-jedd]|uniref:hypothetical protein n=1 Tax=Bacillus sp. B-jedd TaxID=1476857 RepID=UPI0005156DB9|nr:hypothetical protein [Bacillus sp. B-jedd]CEG27314.1 hypothetical protein BN1002_02172 [Bacillus sp. B-jedd]